VLMYTDMVTARSQVATWSMVAVAQLLLMLMIGRPAPSLAGQVGSINGKVGGIPPGALCSIYMTL
jgi:hypothetical protein